MLATFDDNIRHTGLDRIRNIEQYLVNNPITGGSTGVTSFNTRTGAVTPASGDYTAAQVTNAADKNSSSQQLFAGEIATPDLAVSGLTGAANQVRIVGRTAAGPPASGTFAIGDIVVDLNGGQWLCVGAGSPGTWIPLGTALVYSNVLGADSTTLDTGASAIPAAGKVLEVFAYLRTDESATSSTLGLRFNNDSGSDYDRVQVQDINTTVSGTAATGGTMAGASIAAASDASGVFSAVQFVVPQYASGAGNKVGWLSSGVPDQTAANMKTQWADFEWRSTAAINQVQLVISSGSGQKFKAGSSIHVYIK